MSDSAASVVMDTDAAQTIVMDATDAAQTIVMDRTDAAQSLNLDGFTRGADPETGNPIGLLLALTYTVA